MRVLFLTPGKSVKGNTVLPSVLADGFFNDWSFVVGVDNSDVKMECKIPSNVPVIDASNEDVLRDFLGQTPVDILVSLGWGKIIPDLLIRTARLAAINCHSSLLPDYKGASVYRYYWAHAEETAGASIHYLTSKVDSGNLICQQSFSVSICDSHKDILIRASEITGPLLREALLKVAKGYMGHPTGEGRLFPRKCAGYRLRMHRTVNVVCRVLRLPRWYIPNRLV